MGGDNQGVGNSEYRNDSVSGCWSSGGGRTDNKNGEMEREVSNILQSSRPSGAPLPVTIEVLLGEAPL